jgi:hypothetical protein
MKKRRDSNGGGKKTNVELLAERYEKIPRIEETGPQKGFDGKRMKRRGLRWRLIYAAMCAVGLLPLSPVAAGIAMSLSSLCVGLNARRLEKHLSKNKIQCLYQAHMFQ